MSASALARYHLQAGTSFSQTMKMRQFTITFVQTELTTVKWCAYHGMFHDEPESFSNFQRMESWKVRYCKEFSNRNRGGLPLFHTISEDQMRKYAAVMNINITDLPPKELSSRSARALAKQPEVQALIEDPDEAAEADLPEEGEAEELDWTLPPYKRLRAADDSEKRLDRARLDTYEKSQFTHMRDYDKNLGPDPMRDNGRGRMHFESDFKSSVDWLTALDDVRSRTYHDTHCLCANTCVAIVAGQAHTGAH